MKIIFLTFLVFPSISLFALNVDDVITGRILKTSASKKTILLNRGTQDQVLMGMHAKFSSDDGVVARGVVIELSDSRSVWSLYRLSAPDLVESDVVLNVKIAEPVKLTSDESRSVVRESPMGDLKPDRNAQLSLPLDDVDGEVPLDLLGTPVSVSEAKMKESIELRNYPREMLSRVALQSFESKTSSSAGASYSGRTEMNNFLLGVELYFTSEDKWFSNLSILPYFQYQFESMLSYEGTAADTTLMELGLSFQYYFRSPHKSEKFDPFMNAFFAKGTVEDSYSSGSRAQGNGAAASSVTGDSFSYGFGAGVKYFFDNRLCFHLLLEYYLRTDAFEADPQTNNVAWTRDVSGPRVQLGLGYRF